MTWYYTQMVQWHVLLAWCSVALFFTRGLVFQFGTPRAQEIAKDARLLVLVFSVNACLARHGPEPVGRHRLSPHPRQLAGLQARGTGGLHVFCGHWAMSEARLHLLGYLTALALLGLAMDVSINRQCLP